MTTAVFIGLLALAVLWAMHRLRRACDHELVFGRDDRRGWHRHCLHCGYRSRGLTGWHWRDRLFAWMRKQHARLS